METETLSKSQPLSGATVAQIADDENYKLMVAPRIKNFLKLALDQGLFDGLEAAKASMEKMMGGPTEVDINLMVIAFYKFYDTIGPKKDFQVTVNKWVKFWSTHIGVNPAKKGTEETNTEALKKAVQFIDENEKDLTYFATEFGTMFQTILPMEHVMKFMAGLKERNPLMVFTFIRYCECFNQRYETAEESEEEENGKAEQDE